MSTGSQEGSVPKSAATKPKKPGPKARAKARNALEAIARAELEKTLAEAAALPEGDEDELAAMKHVMRSPVDRTYQHWSFRQWLKDDPKVFREKFAGLMRQAGSGSASAPAPSSSSISSAEPVSTTDHIPPVLRELLAPEFAEIEEYHRHREEFLAWKESRTAQSVSST